MAKSRDIDPARYNMDTIDVEVIQQLQRIPLAPSRGLPVPPEFQDLVPEQAKADLQTGEPSAGRTLVGLTPASSATLEGTEVSSPSAATEPGRRLRAKTQVAEESDSVTAFASRARALKALLAKHVLSSRGRTQVVAAVLLIMGIVALSFALSRKRPTMLSEPLHKVPAASPGDAEPAEQQTVVVPPAPDRSPESPPSPTPESRGNETPSPAVPVLPRSQRSRAGGPPSVSETSAPPQPSVVAPSSGAQAPGPAAPAGKPILAPLSRPRD